MVINVTSLRRMLSTVCSRPQPWRIFFGNPQDLELGQNTVTVSAVGFDRAVKLLNSLMGLLNLLTCQSTVKSATNATTGPISECNQFVWPQRQLATRLDFDYDFR